MSMGSVVKILYNGIDITNKCLVDRCSFESQLNAVPGTCEVVVKDPERTLSFVTGKEIVLLIDEVRIWGGFLMQIGRGHAFPADDTSVIGDYDSRLWTLRGVDYNILFDKRIIRNTANYTTEISFPGTTMDGDFLKSVTSSYSDLTNEYDTSQIDNTHAINREDTSKPFAIVQGSYLRGAFTDVSKIDGQIYYIDARKRVHFHSLERTISAWGFSDQPNYAAITAGASGFQDATYGFREVEAVEDGSYIANDAFVWGGSAYTADGGGVVVARYQDAVDSVTSTSNTYIQSGSVTPGSSIDLHGRWQYPELRVGEIGTLNYAKSRADSIINGPTGTDTHGQLKGLRYSQWTFNFTWFSTNVPSISGRKQHLVPGQLVTIEMNVFGTTKLLPLRTLRMHFPSGAPDGSTYVQFTGEFGLQMSDPISLWSFLLDREANGGVTTATNYQPMMISIGTDDSTQVAYGGTATFTPTPVPDGSTTIFSLPNSFGYIDNSLRVILNGLEQRPGVDFLETSPAGGTFTMTSAPYATDNLIVKCMTIAG